jgi:hypothetical protein
MMTPFIGTRALDSFAETLGEKPKTSNDAFSSLERMRLIVSILELPRDEGGCGRDLSSKKEGVQAVMMHDQAQQTQLKHAWAMKPLRVFPDQPLDLVNAYLGERIGLCIHAAAPTQPNDASAGAELLL